MPGLPGGNVMSNVVASACSWICGTPVTAETTSIRGGDPDSYGFGREWA
ncbi:hypothetical protein [Actinocrispum sp. NPDC049592]